MSGYCLSFGDTVAIKPIGSRIPQSTPRPDTWMNIDNNIRSKQDCNSFPIANVASHVPVNGNKINNWYVNQTGRGEINPQNEQQLNLKGTNLWNNLSFKDGAKTTTKETTEYAYAGNAQREDQGTKFWTYTDDPKVTTKETTEYAYTGNAQREDKGTKFWTYEDDLKVTTKETTEYAYVGNAQREDLAYMSRTQYTGEEGAKKSGVRTSGADTYALRGATMVENWTPIPGRQNLLADAQARMGKIDFGTFGSDQNYDGPGTLRQALPDASGYQNNYIIGRVKYQPNKIMAVDDRQIAGYQVQQLKDNPLSIYTTNRDARIPGFECDVTPDNYSTIVTTEDNSEVQHNVYDGINNAVQVYQSNKNENPNSKFVYQDPGNPFLQQGGRANSSPTFSGKCYSGDTQIGWDGNSPRDKQRMSLGGDGEPMVNYGNLYTPQKEDPRVAVGSLCNKPNPQNIYNEGNRALNFATNPQFMFNVG